MADDNVETDVEDEGSTVADETEGTETTDSDSEADDGFDFLGTVKALLAVEDDSKDKILQICIDTATQSVLNYCNISELPSALNYVVCQISADSYTEMASKAGTGKIVGNVASVSEDGRSVSFTNGTELYATVENRVSRLAELRRYRKLYRI